MKPDMFVAPSEAVLLGYCLEKYLIVRHRFPAVSFTNVMASCIDPFIPDLSNTRFTRISEEEMPRDLEATSLGSHLFRCAAEPNTVYGRDGNGPYRRTKLPRTNFRLRLLACVSPYVGMPDWYRDFLEKASASNADMAALEDNVTSELSRVELNPDGTLGDFGKHDNPDQIRRVIVELIEYYELQHYFELGKKFGRAAGGLYLYETARNEKTSWLEPALHVLVGLTLLHDSPEIKQSSVAESAIKSILRVFDKESKFIKFAAQERGFAEGEELFAEEVQPVLGELEDFEMRRNKVIQNLSLCWHGFWVAFGVVLNTIRDDDSDRKQDDASSPSPRAFGDRRNDDPDTIRKYLASAELDLAHGSGGSDFPERVVIQLKDCIEALAKRHWKSEITSGRHVGPILKDKWYVGKSTEERRFGQLAYALHQVYRNVGSHELDHFQCSIDEARHFTSGIRVLLDLSDRIDRQRGR